MVEDALRKIGLTEGEIKVYLALLELGSCTTGKITKKSFVSGSKVYEVLDRLIGKGLASFVEKNGVKHYEAAEPYRIIDYLDEKEKEIEKEKDEVSKIMPQLVLKQKSAQQSVAKIYSGWEGMKTANEDIINSLKKGEEWLSIGLTEQPKAWERYFNHKQKERSKKGIVHKALLNEKYIDVFKVRKKLPLTSYRFLPKEWGGPTSTEIYGDKISFFILLPESPMVAVIENEHIAESYKNYFYALWKGAKKT